MIKLYPMIKVSENKQGGFTLIEIILTLVIAAVVGAGLVQYLGSSLTKSSVPIQRLKQSLKLQEVMEKITADYIENYISDLSGLPGKIGAEGQQENIHYGKYTVIYNEFIKFNSNLEAVEVETGDPENLLMVIIGNTLGETLTTLFSSVE